MMVGSLIGLPPPLIVGRHGLVYLTATWPKKWVGWWAAPGRVQQLAMTGSWDERIDDLRSRRSAAAHRSADLLESACGSWAERIGVVTSHHDLVFMPLGERWPGGHSVRVAWKGTFYEFCYRGMVGISGLTAADRCAPDKAGAVLEAFLCQLVDEN